MGGDFFHTFKQSVVGCHDLREVRLIQNSHFKSANYLGIVAYLECNHEFRMSVNELFKSFF